MPDPTLPPLPPGFTLDTPQAAPGGSMVVGTPRPPKPEFIPGSPGQVYDPATGGAKDIPGFKPKSEATQAPSGYRFTADGNLEVIPGGPADKKGDASTDPDRAFQNDALLKSIAHIRELAQKPMSLGTGTTYLSHVPIIGQNAADMGAAIQQIQGDILRNVLAQSKQASPNGASGFGNLSNVEGENLKASIAHLSQSQSTEEFINGLNQAEQYYRRSLARSNGLDASDPAVAKRFGIELPQGVDAPRDAPVSKDNGITASNQLPIVDVGPNVAASDTEKAVTNPAVARIKPQLEAYMNAPKSKVSDAMIIGFIQKNGIDAAKWPGLLDALKQRGKAQIVVDPTVNVPLSDKGVVPGTSLFSEKDMAHAGTTPFGAFVAGAGDTATFGAIPDIVGIANAATGGSYSQSRGDFKDKQNLLAYEHPDATPLGNMLGAIGTLGSTAPASYGGLLLNAGKQGALYGALSSDDPSLGGRVYNAIADGGTNAAAAGVLDPALRVGAAGGRRAVSLGKRALGVSGEDIANSNALASFAAHAPRQDTAAMRSRATEQGSLGAEPSGFTILDRSGQDYVGRQVSKSPAAREAADQAVTRSEQALPGQIGEDFNQAIDAAAGGDKYVASFLKRPAREIVADIQGLAGREYEAGIAPIANERLSIDADLADTLSHERIKGAISDALSNHTLSDETRQVLRGLPRSLTEVEGAMKPPSVQLGGSASEQVAAMQQRVRDEALRNIPLTVDAARNLATALDRTASRLADGSEGSIELRRLSSQLRQKIGEQYPEFQPVNARYASRMRAIGALEDSRNNYLGDTTGEKTDRLARATSRMSDRLGEPEYKRPGTNGNNASNGFNISRPNQPLPSEKQLAIAGARESATAKAANGDSASAAERLSTPGQKERNRMILADRAAALEARSQAQAGNVRTMQRLQNGGMTDDAGSKVAAGAKAIANLGFHRGGAAIASALSGIRGLGPEDTARIVRLYTDPNKTDFVVSQLERAYGRAKARFIIARIGALATTANKRRTLPPEATQ